jgi:diguanylate cyclase (GGDEF)-like protein
MSEVTNNRARILITDDDDATRRMLHLLLSESYNCVEAASAEEALARLKSEKFDLILSDIVMSGISGIEMLPQVLEITPDVVVIMISDEQTIERAIQAMRAGAFDYIRKPFDLRHVEAAVSRAVEHHRLREAKRRYESRLEEMVEERTRKLEETYTSLLAEIAERRRAEEQVNYLSYYDPITDLPNQKLFRASLTRALAGAQSNDQRVAAILLSIDRFKNINDMLGHALGDQLLRRVAERLNAVVLEGDSAARFDGDEFSLLLTHIGGAEDAIKAAQNVQGHSKRLLKSPDTRSSSLPARESASTLMTALELNSNFCKMPARPCAVPDNRGGNSYQFYTTDMNATARRLLQLENDLRRAVEREELILFYQPQVSSEAQQIIGMEALVRWRHPERGLVSPLEFIPLAEDTGLIVPIGEWVLRTACSQNKAWQNVGFTPLRVGVNLSARQFEQPDLAEMVARILRETGLESRYLELELIESALMKSAETSVGVLHELKAMGVCIAIDDFGTGYSSLSYLRRFPVNKLKIDQSFVREILTNESDAEIVRAVIALGHSLKLKVVTEGVETEAQRAFLRSLGCDEMQGYLFSKPLPAEAFSELLR